MFAGGPGGSIIDSNLWLIDGQLMRLDSDLSSWADIDDLWMSYVLDALLGWSIRRLTPPAIPIDLGDFGKQDWYRNVMSKQVNDGRVLQELVRLGHSNEISRVATYSAIKDTKTQMFQDLQTEMLWDVTN